jgi:hypothetical protein
MKLPLILLTGALALSGSASAQVADSELLRCAELTDTAARLACFDELAAGAKKRQTPQGKAAAIVQAFGAPTAADQTQSIDSEIEGLLDGWGPNTHFRLKNGQVWRVSDGSSATLYLKSPKVTVRRAALGSFLMEFEGSKETARVRRVQ